MDNEIRLCKSENLGFTWWQKHHQVMKIIFRFSNSVERWWIFVGGYCISISVILSIILRLLALLLFWPVFALGGPFYVKYWVQGPIGSWMSCFFGLELFKYLFLRSTIGLIFFVGPNRGIFSRARTHIGRALLKMYFSVRCSTIINT